MDPRQERIGRNEAIFRKVNERLEALNRDFDDILDEAEFVCECGDARCVERIGVSLREYEEVRSDPTAFLVVKGHGAPDVEYVLRETDVYAVVRKHEGGPSELAESLDPRT